MRSGMASVPRGEVPDVQYARRLMVLVSSTVEDLVAGSGIELEDRGSHELRGVPGEWRLNAVSAA